MIGGAARNPPFVLGVSPNGWGAGSLSGTTLTRYLPLGYDSGLAPTTPQDQTVSSSFVVSRLSYNAAIAGSGAQTVSLKLRKNAAVVATVTFAATSVSGTSTFAGIAFVAGTDEIGIQVDKSGSITSPNDFYVTLGS